LNDEGFTNITINPATNQQIIPGILKYSTTNLEQWQDSFSVMTNTITALSKIGVTVDNSLDLFNNPVGY
jgi:hypothetical protein